jgi:hypothetical protein
VPLRSGTAGMSILGMADVLTIDRSRPSGRDRDYDYAFLIAYDVLRFHGTGELRLPINDLLDEAQSVVPPRRRHQGVNV